MKPTKTVTTYGEFVQAYEGLVRQYLGYTPTQIGHGLYGSKLADLVDAHPAFEAQYDAEVAEGSR